MISDPLGSVPSGLNIPSFEQVLSSWIKPVVQKQPYSSLNSLSRAITVKMA